MKIMFGCAVDFTPGRVAARVPSWAVASAEQPAMRPTIEHSRIQKSSQCNPKLLVLLVGTHRLHNNLTAAPMVTESSLRTYAIQLSAASNAAPLVVCYQELRGR